MSQLMRLSKGHRRGSPRILRSSSVVVGGLLVLALVAAALLAPILAPYDPLTVSFNERSQAPSLTHLFGTDSFGRDVLSRVIWGARISLLLGIGAVFVGAIVGVILGLMSGYFRGALDVVLVRVMDIFIAFGQILLAIVVLAILGPGLLNTMIAVAIALVATFTRLTRGQVMATVGNDYVEAVRGMGARAHRIMGRHVLPNIMSSIAVLASLRVGDAILAEAALSFLGMGSSPPTPSWGLMVSDGLASLGTTPWVSLGPGAAIFVTVLGFNLLGDGLRDLSDPRLRGKR